MISPAWRKCSHAALGAGSCPGAGGSPGRKTRSILPILPDLLIVDGGKGQLGRAVKVLERFELLGKIPVAGLAKQKEELFVPGKPESILLPRNSQGLYLIQRVRDEAHRFAITAHRNRRDKAGVASGWISSLVLAQPAAKPFWPISAVSMPSARLRLRRSKRSRA